MTRNRAYSGFTFVEAVVSTALLALLVLVLVSITDQTNSIWRNSKAKSEQFRAARNAFDSMARRLRQATLNTYWDYELDATLTPLRYLRQSELRFISGQASDLIDDPGLDPAGIFRPGHAIFFQAPVGLTGNDAYVGAENLLNTCGFFVEFGPDKRPAFMTDEIAPTRYRFRLNQLVEESEELTLYRYTSGKYLDSSGKTKMRNIDYSSAAPVPGTTGLEWFREPLRSPDLLVRPVAENVLALVILPKLTQKEDPSGTRLAPEYSYDSTAAHVDPSINPKNQLPPILQLTAIVISESSAVRIADGALRPDLGIDRMYETGSNRLFKNAPSYSADLTALENALQNRHLSYRVFTSDISLNGAHWSQEQSN